MGDALATLEPGSGHSIKQLATNSGHTCAILENGSVKCWGHNLYGQLGLGDMDFRGDDPGEIGDAVPTVSFGTGRTALNIVAGSRQTCVRLDTQRVKCWGWNDDGQLGLGDVDTRGDDPGEMGDALPLVNLGTGRTVVELASGSFFECARLDDDEIKCWGNNGSGQLGLGDVNYRGDVAGEMGDSLPSIDFGQ
jgi:alpha-tubulin suppressor-like RCC1 family protein